jgi:plastocyanin
VITFSIALLLTLNLTGQVFAGNITGTVNVKGLRSPENILVFVTKAPPVSVDLSHTNFIMDQRNLTFIPHILPVLVGSTVRFPNNDKVSHNVFSLSRAKKFNLGSYKPGGAKSVLFDKPGIVELRCDVHAEMSAYIMVMKNPYWAITDKKGNFKIPDPELSGRYGIKGIENLPPGRYFIRTWHEKLKTRKIALEVPENGEVSAHLVLTRGVPSVLYK